MAPAAQSATGVALTIHGPAGVVDLVVPTSAAAGDLAREYAEQSGLASIPLIYTPLGDLLPPDRTLLDARLGAGDVLIATTSVHRPTATARRGHSRIPAPPGPLSTLWFVVAAMVAAVAGGAAAPATAADSMRDATVVILLGAAAVGVLPLGRYSTRRAHAAPAFAAAAALIAVWDSQPERLPMVVGLIGLAAATVAAVARALHAEVEEALRVWMIAGGGLFVVSGLTALLGLGHTVVWSLLLVVVVLSSRLVPSLAVDVPDQLLIDLERLAVTAWSARDRLTGRRGRAVASAGAVAAVAARGSRIVTAAAVAIAVVAALSSVLLLEGATYSLDQIGARAQVFFTGATLLLTGRSYRHAGARIALRVAGLACWVALARVWLPEATPAWLAAVAGVAIGMALLLVVVAVATGRGWRSAWWSRRAEIAESLTGACALGSLFVATGLCRTVWALTSGVG